MTAPKAMSNPARAAAPRQRSAGFSFEAFGLSLKSRRLTLNMTLEQVADHSGYAVSSISDLENGMKVTFPKAAAVCEALGVRLSAVLLDAERAMGRATTPRAHRRPPAARSVG